VGAETLRYARQQRPRQGAEALATLVARQHGVVTRKQLEELGHSGGAVDGWVRRGRVHRIRRGVYAVGHTVLTDEGRWMAAVLACGAGAALSHRSAAALWGIGAREARDVDVTAARTRHPMAGIAVHRSRRLDRDEVTTLRNVPVTTLPRTIVDLADVLAERDLARAVHEAQVVHSLGDRALHEAVAKAHGRRGAGRLRNVVGEGPDRSRSELERRFLRLCDRHGLPRPVVNETVAGLECDFVWRERRLVAETDGWRYHRTRRAFELDRRRDQQLARAGFRTLRFTHRQVESGDGEVAATLRAASARRAPRR
jgi:hypothetical protein